MIYEELFKKEVLSRREPLRISEIKYMKSFTCHLHLHRFTRKQWDFPRSGLLNDSLEEAAAKEECQLLHVQTNSQNIPVGYISVPVK